MSEVKIQVRYRDPTTDPPDEFLWATLDDTNPAVLIVIEKLNSLRPETGHQNPLGPHRQRRHRARMTDITANGGVIPGAPTEVTAGPNERIVPLVDVQFRKYLFDQEGDRK